MKEGSKKESIPHNVFYLIVQFHCLIFSGRTEKTGAIQFAWMRIEHSAPLLKFGENKNNGPAATQEPFPKMR